MSLQASSIFFLNQHFDSILYTILGFLVYLLIRGIPFKQRKIGQGERARYGKPFGDSFLIEEEKKNNEKKREVIIIGGAAAGLSAGSCLNALVKYLFF